MEEYREHEKPAVISAKENENLLINPWQIMIANFDAELSDGKATFNQKTTQQSVHEKYSIYVMVVLSAGSTSDTLGF